ncbi:unnamed protein product [Dibothriocephalus latus]|uniref:Uncharacterized protein n=1 Tax=Dibothriocephalus latus TaxID=60516 RepID=A0A3P7LSH9_DIBLA|nr:unnamed protein product [Dibothriocephalus latus]
MATDALELISIRSDLRPAVLGAVARQCWLLALRIISPSSITFSNLSRRARRAQLNRYLCGCAILVKKLDSGR